MYKGMNYTDYRKMNYNYSDEIHNNDHIIIYYANMQ